MSFFSHFTPQDTYTTVYTFIAWVLNMYRYICNCITYHIFMINFRTSIIPAKLKKKLFSLIIACTCKPVNEGIIRMMSILILIVASHSEIDFK